MARPKKEYCDYFSHDRDMRNHRKIKALRLKYGIQGYAIWVMFLEFLTGNNNNIFENSDIELELLSGDFGVSVTEISDMINYCIRLNLLVEKDGIIYSESLNERLEFVYNKRNRKKSFSSEQPRLNGSFCDNNAVTDVVSVTEMPQSKVKESKVNKKKGKEEYNTFIVTEAIEEQNKLESSYTQNVLIENSNLFRQPNIPTFEKVHEAFLKNGGTKEMATKFFDTNNALGWFFKNSPIVNFTSLISSYVSSWKNNEEKKITYQSPKSDYKVQTPREDW